MRLLCHLLCLGLNLAYGTCVAAAPAEPQPASTLSLAAARNAPASHVLIHPLNHYADSAVPLSYISVGKFISKPGEIDSGLHRIRFVDRYWPAKMGFEPPVRVSSLCFNTTATVGKHLV